MTEGKFERDPAALFHKPVPDMPGRAIKCLKLGDDVFRVEWTMMGKFAVAVEVSGMGEDELIGTLEMNLDVTDTKPHLEVVRFASILGAEVVVESTDGVRLKPEVDEDGSFTFRPIEAAR